MGSKTSEDQDSYNDTPSSTSSTTDGAGKPRGAHFDQDGDGEYGNGDNGDPDGDNSTAGDLNHDATQDAKKKKKKRKRSKKKGSAPTAAQQSSPPRILVSDVFPSGIYPQGEALPYNTDDNLQRTTGEEKRYLFRLATQTEEWANNYRKAAEVHRQVRQYTQQTAKPGVSLTQVANDIEDGIRALLGNQGLGVGEGLKSGIGFPTGLALNHCAAHFTPNPGQKDIVLQHQDVLKVDFGVHIDGWIVDSAFTMSFDPKYDNLLEAVKQATNTGIKHAGIDARVSEIGAEIQEVMESYEVELKGKPHRVKALRNITGHNIKQYQIHGGKSVPFIANNDPDKMEEGEVFAIETFGSTGSGRIRDGIGNYGYGRRLDARKASVHTASAKTLLKTIDQNFGSLVFCRRYLERLGVEKYLLGLNTLVNRGVLESYAPLVDVEGCYTAQFEHTIILHANGTEVISRGNDY